MWNVIYNGWSNKSHLATSPNTAPAMQNECHQWSASHMKRHFQDAEQVKSPFKLTKYCACQEIVSSRFQREIPEVLPPIDDSNRSDNKVIISQPHLTRPILGRTLYEKIQHFALRLSSRITRNAALARKSHAPTSPNTAPGTKNALYSSLLYSLLASIL